ncbi:RagB/SusD family nutrient uptake outer membrane protein [Niastella sp. OAS944]|uniref:RagB/SusD family nutrient uptake outer membrane protein n=1 Tax=Niastella sp. OAS944 TaxID=2664089 RepID=UPI0034858356|nr:hypothetical protein [Chitinophagaceae bacterium OAS944]
MASFNNYISFLILGTLSVFFTSCKKFVEVEPPISRMVTQTVFENAASATAAQTAIYTQMERNTESYNIASYTGFLGDELMSWSTNADMIQHYTNSITSQNPYSTRLWKNAYYYIYQANSIIEGVNDSKIDTVVSKQLLGEAKFIRAYWHFYLTNLFGDIPIVISTDYNVNMGIFRSSQSEVYRQIKGDLTDAKNLLSSDYLNETSTITTMERTRPTKWAASALLARAYLYSGDYDNAILESDAIIAKTDMYSLKSDLNDVFLKNSTEAIWQIQIPLPTTINTADGANFILRSTPGLGLLNNSTISTPLKNAFEINDKRKSNWTHDTTISGKTYTYPYKYKVYTGSIITEYSMILRLAELFLIRSEAQAEKNNISNAVADLNKIRNRAGLPDYSGLMDKDSVLDAIYHERRVELFTEWGHRWLDLIRTNTIDKVMNSAAPAKGGTWSHYKALYPIPQSEILINSNLKQNEGYQ